MLTVETIGRIRREHFIKGKTIKEIARDLKVSRNTVRRVLRSGATSFEYERDVQPRPKLGRWTEDLDTLLTGNAAKPVREQLTLIRIFEELRGRFPSCRGNDATSENGMDRPCSRPSDSQDESGA
jgi:Homeodomain-like domain